MCLFGHDVVGHNIIGHDNVFFFFSCIYKKDWLRQEKGAHHNHLSIILSTFVFMNLLFVPLFIFRVGFYNHRYVILSLAIFPSVFLMFTLLRWLLLCKFCFCSFEYSVQSWLVLLQTALIFLLILIYALSIFDHRH